MGKAPYDQKNTQIKKKMKIQNGRKRKDNEENSTDKNVS
jgi:hypothetical protein